MEQQKEKEEKQYPVYKVNYMSNATTIDSIFVFHGYSLAEKEWKDMLKREPGHPMIQSMFNEEELMYIQ